ncbi:hypothetical protein HOLleu_04063 [Holothuria leucospilota]|uniref:DDE-1 domain-containing protein n=1 Tax=Holothuria leucospilota TaxID=206669 RepID=A0A9Q1CTS8_HOLLE|nr:hypothetical protein HOLleu_04063 [Holothuria leucospilota]
MDETGVSNVRKPGNISSTKGTLEVGKMTSHERGKAVTVICATNAVGIYIPPMFIFPRKGIVDTLMNNGPAGAIGHCTESGWADEESFLKWLRHFCQIAKQSVKDKRANPTWSPQPQNPGSWTVMITTRNAHLAKGDTSVRTVIQMTVKTSCSTHLQHAHSND